MDEDTATRFISSLVKSIQALCNGYVDFSSSIEVIGHIHLNIDHSKKLDYVLTEKVSKSTSEDAIIFSSRSYHSKPPQSVSGKDMEASKPSRRKTHQVPRVDDSECDSLIIRTVPKDLLSSSHPEGDDSQTGNCSSQQNSITVLYKKPERQQALSKHTQFSPDRRKRSTPLPLYRTLSPAAECSRDSVTNYASSESQKADFGVMQIKDEPLDDPPVCFEDCASTAAGSQDIQTPDFSNVVMESLDRVGQIEGTQFVAAGNMMQMQQQHHHHQPFPVMLHASPVVPLSGIPTPGFHDSPPSTESQSTASTSGEVLSGRRVRKPTAKAVQTPYSFKSFRTKAAKKRLTQTAPAAAKKKSNEVGAASVSRSSKVSRGKMTKASMRRLKKSCEDKRAYRAYTEEDVLEAIELIHGGVPVIDAALKYGIPRATLFNRSRDGCKTHTGRCSEVFSRTHGGQKKRPKNMQYTKKAVEKAIEAVHAGMPVIDASILYHIPRATLFIRSAKGCPTHTGRCSTVFSHGKLRRTKAPKHKYMALHKQASKIYGKDGESSGSFDILQGVPVVNPVTGEVITFKTEPEDTELTDFDNSASTSLQGEDLLQGLGSETRSDSEAQGIQPTTIVVKMETPSDTEN